MIRYRIRFPERATHHLDVELEVDALAATELWLPTWTPGSYLIREFARNLRRLTATGEGGRPLAVERLDKTSFRVASGAGETVRLGYRVYANELSVRTSYVDASFAVLNGASVFLAVAGREGEACTLRCDDLPDGWACHTGLGRGEGSPALLEASDYAELIDGPLLLGKSGTCGAYGEIAVREFTAGGRPHRFVLTGAGNHALDSIADDARRIVDAAARDFGPLPYSEYTFLLFTTRETQSGLEHRNSTLLAFPRHSFRDDKLRVDLQSLIAHEHFHSWNVKRTKPREFVPYDLKSETYTRALWVCEGVTSYYDELLVLRAGLVSREQYLGRLGDEITRYLENPGRNEQSLEESSLVTWTRFYRQDEDFPNSGISYYQKGALVSLLLDLRIRRATESARSLDHVMRALFEMHGADSRGFSLEEFEALASDVAGEDLSSFFDQTVRGTAELEFAAALAEFGVKLSREDRAPSPSVRDWIGIRVKPGASPLRIDVVERGSAAERGGLTAGDEIVALDGQRVAAGSLAERLADARGREVRVTCFRDDALATVEVEVPASPSKVVKLSVLATPGADPAAAAARLEKWLPTPIARIAEGARRP